MFVVCRSGKRVFIFFLDAQCRDERGDPVPSKDRESSTTTREEETFHGDDSLTGDREEDSARSPGFSPEDSCETGDDESALGKILQIKTIRLVLCSAHPHHACAVLLETLPP